MNEEGLTRQRLVTVFSADGAAEPDIRFEQLEPPIPVEASSERDKWLAKRRTGIGSSDIAALVGASPYDGPLSVWLDKTGRKKDGIEVRHMRLGRILEPIILSEFNIETKKAAELDGRHYVSPVNPIFLATPDGLVEKEDAGVELKAPGLRQASKWGDSWSGEFPEHYLAQCLWQMGVTGRPSWYLAALIGGQDFRVYRIERDDNLIAGLQDAAARFWRDHVLTDIAPEVDASDSARRYLETVWPRNTQLIRLATPEEEALARELAEARAAKDAAEEAVLLVRNRLCDLIGEAEGLKLAAKSGKITWKTQAGRKTVDYEAVVTGFLELADREATPSTAIRLRQVAAELIEANTKRGADFRVFRVSGPLFKGEE